MRAILHNMARESQPDVEVERQVDAVMRASRVLFSVVTRSMQAVEAVLTPPQFRILVIIASRGSVNLGEVAEALGVHASNATRSVDRLVTAGFVERADNPDDRRYLVLKLAPKGHDLVERVMAYRRSSFTEIMQQMSPARRRSLAQVLEAFAEAANEPVDGEEDFLLGVHA